MRDTWRRAGQRNLRDPLARPELAAQEQLAHAQQRPQRLRVVTIRSRHRVHRSTVLGVTCGPRFVCMLTRRQCELLTLIAKLVRVAVGPQIQHFYARFRWLDRKHADRVMDTRAFQ